MPYISKKRAREYGYENPNLQTIQVPKNFGTISEIKHYLEKHGYLFKNWRQTKNFYRFIQNDVINNADYFSEKLPNGIILTYQHY